MRQTVDEIWDARVFFESDDVPELADERAMEDMLFREAIDKCPSFRRYRLEKGLEAKVAHAARAGVAKVADLLEKLLRLLDVLSRYRRRRRLHKLNRLRQRLRY